MSYLFNGKELDQETNLTYFGARYLDMKTSLWLNTDPLSGYNPIQETEHYIDGQHNGGIFNPMNMATYSYTYQNPIVYIDPNGKQTYFDAGPLKQQLNSTVNTLKKNIQKSYDNTKQIIKNTYNTAKNNIVQAGKNTQTWVRNNKTTLLKQAKDIQDLGDGVAVTGYTAAVAGAPFAGIGATPGAVVATTGHITSTVGSVMEIGVNFISGEYTDASEGVAIVIGGELINMALDKAIPGPTPNISKEAKSLLKESNKIKTMMIEKSAEKIIENRKDK